MNDGTVTIRPIAPADRDGLRAAFERLSPESRYRRFFVAITELSDQDLSYLTEVDHRDHEALVAIDEASGGIVGVARFVRTSADEAEPAIVVADDWQRRGVATRLLDALAERAREESIARFRAPVLAQNPAAVRVLSRLGPTVTTSSGPEMELDIVLTPQRPARSRLMSLLRRTADGTLSPAFTLLHRIAWRPPQTPLDRSSLRNSIVVGTDGSDAARATVLRAAKLATNLGADLDVVFMYGLGLETPGSPDREHDALTRTLRDQGLSVRVYERRGGPVASIVDVAADQRARLIVVDASQRIGPARLLTGDVPYAIARHASCDVLLLR